MAIIGVDIYQAKLLLENNELVGMPTETVYGLAGNALSTRAISKIFEAKDRPFFDPLIVHVANLEAANKYVANIPAQAKKLADCFWPGPLTLLLKKKNNIPELATAGLDTVGMRCPNHPLTLQLLSVLDFPLAAPSANPFGYISPTRATHVNQQLGSKIEYILDGGDCNIGLESTIVGFENEKPTIYRMGGLSIEQIEAVVGAVNIEINSSSNPTAPGQLKSHYAPSKKLFIGNTQTNCENGIGVLAFKMPSPFISLENQRILSPTGNLVEAAQNLFSFLRELDQLNIKSILAEEVPDVGLGRAINDRLRRAAAQP
jgi:L-threonylcarbamoyladenylate synthase